MTNSKDPKFIWKHLRSTTKKSETLSNKLPSELKLNDEIISDSESVASKLNVYFSSIAQIINEHNDEVETMEPDKLRKFVESKIPENVSFKIPLITSEQVLSFINKLDPAKATGIDGLGPKIINPASKEYRTHMGPRWVIIWVLYGQPIWDRCGFCNRDSSGTHLGTSIW